MYDEFTVGWYSPPPTEAGIPRPVRALYSPHKRFVVYPADGGGHLVRHAASGHKIRDTRQDKLAAVKAKVAKLERAVPTPFLDSLMPLRQWQAVRDRMWEKKDTAVSELKALHKAFSEL